MEAVRSPPHKVDGVLTPVLATCTMSDDIITHITDEVDTCPVCCSSYTATVRKPVSCPSCNYAACTGCVKGFLLSTKADPHCMNCRHVWNREFLDKHLTRSWREGALKRHREATLFDRERSLLPSSQAAIESRLEKDAAEKAIKEARAELIAIRARKRELNALIERNQVFVRTGRWPASSEKPAEPVKRQFVAACPDEGCRGFLSTAYKCGTCAKQFCSKCRELAEEEGKEHTCDPELVATMKAILADSRPCPSCGTAISRVSGCDQMYCTQCNTAFSYSTGKPVTGVIHNPHYFERMAKLKKEGAEATVAAGGAGHGAVEECGANGWPSYRATVSAHPILPSIKYPSKRVQIGGLYQFGLHLQEVELPELPQPDIPTDNTDLRVQYLLKEIDEKQFRQKLQRRARERERDLEFRGPLELALVTILEFYVWLAQPAQLTLSKRTDIARDIELRFDAINEFLMGYINDSLRKIGDRYANRAPQIQFTNRRASGYYLNWNGYQPAKSKGKSKDKETATVTSDSLSDSELE